MKLLFMTPQAPEEILARLDKQLVQRRAGIDLLHHWRGERSERRFDIVLNPRQGRGPAISLTGVLVRRPDHTLVWLSLSNQVSPALSTLLILLPPFALLTILVHVPIYLALPIGLVCALWLVNLLARQKRQLTAQVLQLLSNDLDLDSQTPLVSAADREGLNRIWKGEMWNANTSKGG